MLKRIPFAEWLPSENHGYTDEGSDTPYWAGPVTIAQAAPQP